MCLSPKEAAGDAGGSIIFIATLGDAAFKEGFKLLSQLRMNGIRASMDFSARSLKSQMRAADKQGARYVIILGDDEIKKNCFVLKDMKDSSQKELELGKAIEILKRDYSKC